MFNNIGTQVLEVGKQSNRSTWEKNRNPTSCGPICQQSNLLEAHIIILRSCFFIVIIILFHRLYGFHSSSAAAADAVNNNNNSIYYYCKVSNVRRTRPRTEGIDAAVRSIHTSLFAIRRTTTTVRLARLRGGTPLKSTSVLPPRVRRRPRLNSFVRVFRVVGRPSSLLSVLFRLSSSRQSSQFFLPSRKRF